MKSHVTMEICNKYVIIVIIIIITIIITDNNVTMYGNVIQTQKRPSFRSETV